MRTATTEQLDELSLEACLDLLARHRFGRLAIDDGHGPVILPVNFRLEQGTVLIRTEEGTKLGAADRQAPASLEVDHVSDDRQSGWSVLVRGRLRRLMGTQGGYATEPTPYPDGGRPHLVGLFPSHVSGRRFGAEEVGPPRRAPLEASNVWRGRDGDDLLG